MADKIACNLTLDEIKELADIVSEKNLGKIEIKLQEGHIIIEGNQTASTVFQPVMQTNNSVSPAVVPSAEGVTATDNIQGNVVKAPIVGTFYASPSPDKQPFIKEGQSVKKGDVLFIVESMKLMNEIQSDYEGVVKKILVTNGSAVEYDQPVLIIE